MDRYANTLWAYSYTHIDTKTNSRDPKICAYKLDHLIEINKTSEIFNEIEVARLHYARTGYDYSHCKFALLTDRDWFA
jgi:hypothetical protein